MLSGILVIPYADEIVTAITIIGIGAILAIYLSILKKNGWIGKPSNYRCPNPQCQKIFQTPLKVKDFSNKKNVHLACPECGYDLGSSNDETIKELNIENTSQSKINPTSEPIETKVSVTTNANKEPKAIESPSPTIELKESTSLPETNHKLTPKQKTDNYKKDRPTGCNHHFGYLGTLPKGTETPDECYSCARLIECFK